MSIFGELERFLSEDLYPYRWPLSIAAAVFVAVSLVVAYRLGAHRRLAEHWKLSAAIGVPAVVVFGVVAWALLSPLWERSTLIEESPLTVANVTPTANIGATGSPSATPTVTATAPTDAPPVTETVEPAAFEARVVASGEWQGADDFHFARGQALIIETEPGVYVLRVENFSVRNGPDLFVYLSTSADGYGEGGINLGGLKATDGAFNYEIPAGTDISQFRSAIVWCDAFDVLFGTAAFGPLM